MAYGTTGKRTNDFPSCDGTYDVSIPAGDSLVIIYSLSTQDENSEYTPATMTHCTGITMMRGSVSGIIPVF